MNRNRPAPPVSRVRIVGLQRATRRTGTRLFAVMALAGALTIAPSAAFADGFTGTTGDDDITGTAGSDSISGDGDVNGGDDLAGGNDTITGAGGEDFIDGDGEAYDGGDLNGGDDMINGGDGDDSIIGDGDAVGGGDLNGGDDIIYGGAGDDDIIGDGGAFSEGPGDGTVNGGNDEIHGGDGNDNIAGDGFESRNVNGGNDVLFGDAGDDSLVGESGNDLLCGGDGHLARNDADTLIGAEGDDLACAVDDETTVAAGAINAYALAANDEILDDEAEETLALIYALCGGSALPAGIVGTIAPTTGVFTYTATQSGTVRYSVSRGESEVALSSCADFVIRVLVPEVEPPTEETEQDDDRAGDQAEDQGHVTPAAHVVENTSTPRAVTPVLPATGAGQNLNLVAALGITLLISGTVVLAGNRRRKPLI